MPRHIENKPNGSGFPTLTRRAECDAEGIYDRFYAELGGALFNRLVDAGVRKVIDVRVHNRSQLAGFTKSGDLAWFLGKLGGIGYEHAPALTPTGEMLKSYRAAMASWDTYARQFRRLMAEREIERTFQPQAFEEVCLLCSEATPHQCHRRLVCEYLNEKWNNALTVRHL